MNAVFRCDATADIGFGHLSRSIALAEAFRLLQVRSTFAGLFDVAAKGQIEVAGFEDVDLPRRVGEGDANLSGALKQHPEFIVVDSYGADEAYLWGLRALDCKIVMVDDFRTLSVYPCDVVLNFTWEASSLGYPKGPVLLLGPRYFPARRKLVELRPRSMERCRSGRVANLLVAIGGADPRRIAARLIRLLRAQAANLCLRVVAANEQDLSETLDDFQPGSRVLPRQPDLSEQLLWADACITGGGLIKYECAFMGVPAAAIAQNEGQDRETRSLSAAGLVFDLGLAENRSDEQLAEALDSFLSGEDLRDGIAGRARETFPPDPSAEAARAILEAVGH